MLRSPIKDACIIAEKLEMEGLARRKFWKSAGLFSEAAQVARGWLRCLGLGEILRDRLRFS